MKLKLLVLFGLLLLAAVFAGSAAADAICGPGYRWVIWNWWWWGCLPCGPGMPAGPC